MDCHVRNFVNVIRRHVIGSVFLMCCYVSHCVYVIRRHVTGSDFLMCGHVNHCGIVLCRAAAFSCSDLASRPSIAARTCS